MLSTFLIYLYVIILHTFYSNPSHFSTLNKMKFIFLQSNTIYVLGVRLPFHKRNVIWMPWILSPYDLNPNISSSHIIIIEWRNILIVLDQRVLNLCAFLYIFLKIGLKQTCVFNYICLIKMIYQTFLIIVLNSKFEKPIVKSARVFKWEFITFTVK